MAKCPFKTHLMECLDECPLPTLAYAYEISTR
jgi:hypothetical protein